MHLSVPLRELFAAGAAQTVAVIVLFAVGLALIIKGGDVFVDAATWMAEASGIPKFIIGATIVSVATTLPELLVSLFAAASGGSDGADMAIGNAIGSVTANTGLIMGVSLIFMPMVIKRSQIAFKGIMMIFAVALLWLLCSNGLLSVWEAVIVLLICVVFILENLFSGAKEKSLEERPQITKKLLTVNILKFVLGAAALAVGSDLLVDNGEFIAVNILHVPVRIVAITLVAIGTSLPELVTAITSLMKKQGSMSVGNIIGANIIDLTVILPLCAIVSGGTLHVAPASVRLDMPVCLMEAVIAIVPTLIFKRFHRLQGILMVALYIAYLVWSMLG